MYLIDTNIFLEVLLGQEKTQECKDFLVNNLGHLEISDFTLHSIGVYLVDIINLKNSRSILMRL